jgi:hypothetical protein
LKNQEIVLFLLTAFICYSKFSGYSELDPASRKINAVDFWKSAFYRHSYKELPENRIDSFGEKKKGRRPIMKKVYNQLVRLFLIIIILLLTISMLWGCSGKYGYIQKSREAGRSFESLQIWDDHIYYYSGPAAIPYAVIGIHKDYTLKTRLWKKIDLTPDQLRIWLILGMQGTFGFPPSGSYIFGSDGQKIGIWYSIFNHTVVKMENDNVVVVHPPSSYPGQRVRPSIERGSIDSKKLFLGEIDEDWGMTFTYAAIGKQD